MVNTTNKGRRIELLARKELEKDGYLVEKKNASRWQSNDFWGLFDIIAIHPIQNITRLIQIKSNRSHFYTACKEIAEWGKNKCLNCEVWLKENRKPWRKWVQ